jgi:hypothetical protein
MGGFGGPEWHAEDVVLPGTDGTDRVTLFYRDLQECGDFQFGRPWFAGKMSLAPEIHYDADELARLIDNPWTAEDWNERQVSKHIYICQLTTLIYQSDRILYLLVLHMAQSTWPVIQRSYRPIPVTSQPMLCT